ncbi:GNAT family N-acetyltransferase [Nocardioides speluncae]|uniref:GNAT family N-acetyltransferase n=1 Tax=Nocardioides speluncae TaxID=2670337 RepID=UPI000D693360|nr:GNAT family protein [Nocardioides speluncae]
MRPAAALGARISLRELDVTDIDDAVAIVGDDEVTQWLSFDARDSYETAAMIQGVMERAALSPRTEYYLAVTPSTSIQMIGFARLGLEGVKAANLGYSIRHADWGKGYATDAARTMTTFGFEVLGLHRIAATIGPDNNASIAVVEKLGFTYEGCIRDHVFTNGAWRDSLLFSVLECEWKLANHLLAEPGGDTGPRPEAP